MRPSEPASFLLLLTLSPIPWRHTAAQTETRAPEEGQEAELSREAGAGMGVEPQGSDRGSRVREEVACCWLGCRVGNWPESAW